MDHNDQQEEHRVRLLRLIPPIHKLLDSPESDHLRQRYGRQMVANALRAAQQAVRQYIKETDLDDLTAYKPTATELISRAEQHLDRLTRISLRPVINATGVIVHTNLGRSKLAPAAIEAVLKVAGSYSNLEFDLDQGRRGSRHHHYERLLVELTGAEAAFAVNNNAAAVLLSLSAVAAGKEVIVSRGELVEIGGSFRVPEVMEQSGARLVEVGTTNKTKLDDYRRAISENTAALLKVHTSNYRIIGFTEETPLPQLVQLGAEYELPVIYDLGSGAFLDEAISGIRGEPTVTFALQAGVDLVMFSGDKLLGGPQAGIILGRRDLIERCRRHPLARAVRIDKMTAAALEATLLLYLDQEKALEQIPTLKMMSTPLDTLRKRAQDLAVRLRQILPHDLPIVVTEDYSYPGGGSLPEVKLPTVVVAIDLRGHSAAKFDRALRMSEPPVVGRIADDRLLLDLRTIADDEIEGLMKAMEQATTVLNT